MIVDIFESKILVKALSNPAFIAVNKVLPALNSSFVLSNIKMILKFKLKKKLMVFIFKIQFHLNHTLT